MSPVDQPFLLASAGSIFIRLFLRMAYIPKRAQLGDMGNFLCVFSSLKKKKQPEKPGYFSRGHPNPYKYAQPVSYVLVVYYYSLPFLSVYFVSCRFMGIRSRTSWWSRESSCHPTCPCTRLPWTGSSSASPTTPPR